MGLKTGTTERGRRRRKRAQWKRTRLTHDLIFEREGYRCRCCGLRRAKTMHELIPRSIGGKACLSNSVAVCGDGTRGCHGYCQRYEIAVGDTPEGAEGTLTFTPKTTAAAAWMRVAVGQVVVSHARGFEGVSI